MVHHHLKNRMNRWRNEKTEEMIAEGSLKNIICFIQSNSLAFHQQQGYYEHTGKEQKHGSTHLPEDSQFCATGTFQALGFSLCGWTADGSWTARTPPLVCSGTTVTCSCVPSWYVVKLSQHLSVTLQQRHQLSFYQSSRQDMRRAERADLRWTFTLRKSVHKQDFFQFQCLNILWNIERVVGYTTQLYKTMRWKQDI